MNTLIQNIVDNVMTDKIRNRISTKDKNTIEYVIKDILSKIKYGASTLLSRPFNNNIFDKRNFDNAMTCIKDDIDILYAIGRNVDLKYAEIENTVNNVINFMLSYVISTYNNISNPSINNKITNYIAFNTGFNNSNDNQIYIDPNMTYSTNNIYRSIKYASENICNIDILEYNKNIKPIYISDKKNIYKNQLLSPYYKKYILNTNIINESNLFGLTINEQYLNKHIVGIILRFNGYININEIKLRLFSSNYIELLNIIYTHTYIGDNDLDNAPYLTTWQEIEHLQYNSMYRNTYHVINFNPIYCQSMIIFFALSNPIRHSDIITYDIQYPINDINEIFYSNIVNTLDGSTIENILSNSDNDSILKTFTTVNSDEYIFGISYIDINYNIYAIDSYYESEKYVYNNNILCNNVSINGKIICYNDTVKSISEYLLSDPTNDDGDYVKTFVYPYIKIMNNTIPILPNYNKNKRLPIFLELNKNILNNTYTCTLPYLIDASNIGDVFFLKGIKIIDSDNILSNYIFNNSYISFNDDNDDIINLIKDAGVVLTNTNQLVIYAYPQNNLDNYYISDLYNELYLKTNFKHKANFPQIFVLGKDKTEPTAKIGLKRFVSSDVEILDDGSTFVIDYNNINDDFNINGIENWCDIIEDINNNKKCFFTDLRYISYVYSTECYYKIKELSSTYTAGQTVTVILDDIYVPNSVNIYYNGTPLNIVITQYSWNNGFEEIANNNDIKTISFVTPFDITANDDINIYYTPLVFYNIDNTLYTNPNNILSNMNSSNYIYSTNISDTTNSITLPKAPLLYERIIKNKSEWMLSESDPCKYVNKYIPSSVSYSPFIFLYGDKTLKFVESEDLLDPNAANILYTLSNNGILLSKPIKGNVSISYTIGFNEQQLELRYVNLQGNNNITNAIYSVTLATDIDIIL